MSIIQSILPIFIALLAGYASGRFLPKAMSIRLVRLIVPLVWALLFLIGEKFGAVISSAESMLPVLQTALLFAVLTTVTPCGLIVVAMGKLERGALVEASPQPFSMRLAWAPIRECLVALSMVFLGSGYFLIGELFPMTKVELPSGSTALLMLIVLVGIDLTQVKVEPSWFSRSVLLVVGSVIVGSFAGASAAAWLSGEDLPIALALSSGFGWFTLSSVLIGKKLGQMHGTMAFMIDLLRELFAIMILYAFGKLHPHASVGSAGATALDSTLPIIKQVCGRSAVPLALVSGFILTVLAPILIALFLR